MQHYTHTHIRLHTLTHTLQRRQLTSSWDQVPVRNEEFIPIMLFQNVWQNLQCKMFLLSGFLTPLVWIHFSVGHVCIVVFIFLKHTQNGESQSNRFPPHKSSIHNLQLQQHLWSWAETTLFPSHRLHSWTIQISKAHERFELEPTNMKYTHKILPVNSEKLL